MLRFISSVTSKHDPRFRVIGLCASAAVAWPQFGFYVGHRGRSALADDGTPGGLLTAEIMKWTEHVIAAPRSDPARLLGRSETGKTRVYILLGDDPAGLDGLLPYVGEGNDVGKRWSQHARPEGAGGKDFWDLAIVVTSKDAKVTKAHARYLESRFITLALQAGRCRLENGTAPPPLPLPEADASDMEYFIGWAHAEQVRVRTL